MNFFSTLFGGRRHLPMCLQTESSECGLACLAMIFGYFGSAVDLASMRRRFATSSRGMTLSRIIAYARDLGFESRPLRVELEYLPHLQAPCVLHWNLNHFVVLKRATAKRVEIHDPAAGHRILTAEEVSKHFTGIALELQPTPDFQPVKEAPSIRWSGLMGRLEGAAGALTQIVLLALSLEIFTLVIPLYFQTVLDQVLVTTDTQLLTVLGIAFLLIISFRAAINIARGWAISLLGARLNAQWASQLFSHLLRLPMSFFERRQTGDVTSRFASVQSIQQTLTGTFVESVLDSLMGCITLGILIVYSVPLTAIVIAIFVIYAICRRLAYQKLWEANEQQITLSARQQTSLLEAVRGAQSIKLANKQSERAARFANITFQCTQRNLAVQRIGFAFSTISQWLAGAQRIAVIWVAATYVLQGSFSIGMLVAFVTYADQLATRFGSLIDKFIELRLVRLHATRVADITMTPPEETCTSASKHRTTSHEIEIDNVSFRYSDGEPWILRNCTMRIEAGESVAIVGASGCGKTTLIKIILGLLEPIEGGIKIGGVDIKNFGLASYRDYVGAVMQDDQLFEGSIADNISFFDDAAQFDDVETVARQAGIHDEVCAMPMAYETFVGDMGTTLSGGQKQRVLLARALYRKPAILVLDEATSHLDVDRERAINASVQQMNVTRIVIAHRPETISASNRVVALRDARLTEIRYQDVGEDSELMVATR